MSFEEVQFPPNISYGSRGGPSFNTAIIETDGGAEQRISRWSQPRHKYDVKYGIRSHADLSTVRAFYIARLGAATGFRFKDWGDFKSTEDSGPESSAVTPFDQQIGVGDGNITSFQLVKRYSSGSTSLTRTILKPVSGTVRVSVNGVEVTSGFTVNTVTGVVLFDSAPTDTYIIRAGFEFDVPVRFEKEVDMLLSAAIDDYSSGTMDSITLIEIVNPTPVAGAFYYGGALLLEDMDSDRTLAPTEGRTIIAEPVGSARDLVLTNPSTYPLGGPYHAIKNIGSVNLRVKDHSFNTIITLSANQSCTIYLGITGSSVKTFYAI